MIISLAVRLAEIKIETVGNTLAVLEAMALFDTLAERHSEKEFNPHTLFELEAAAQVNTIGTLRLATTDYRLLDGRLLGLGRDKGFSPEPPSWL